MCDEEKLTPVSLKPLEQGTLDVKAHTTILMATIQDDPDDLYALSLTGKLSQVTTPPIDLFSHLSALQAAAVPAKSLRSSLHTLHKDSSGSSSPAPGNRQLGVKNAKSPSKMNERQTRSKRVPMKTYKKTKTTHDASVYDLPEPLEALEGPMKPERNLISNIKKEPSASTKSARPRVYAASKSNAAKKPKVSSVISRKNKAEQLSKPLSGKDDTKGPLNFQHMPSQETTIAQKPNTKPPPSKKFDLVQQRVQKPSGVTKPPTTFSTDRVHDVWSTTTRQVQDDKFNPRTPNRPYRPQVIELSSGEDTDSSSELPNRQRNSFIERHTQNSESPSIQAASKHSSTAASQTTTKVIDRVIVDGTPLLSDSAQQGEPIAPLNLLDDHLARRPSIISFSKHGPLNQGKSSSAQTKKPQTASSPPSDKSSGTKRRMLGTDSDHVFREKKQRLDIGYNTQRFHDSPKENRSPKLSSTSVSRPSEMKTAESIDILHAELENHSSNAENREERKHLQEIDSGFLNCINGSLEDQQYAEIEKVNNLERPSNSQPLLLSDTTYDPDTTLAGDDTTLINNDSNINSSSPFRYSDHSSDELKATSGQNWHDSLKPHNRTLLDSLIKLTEVSPFTFPL